MAKFPSNRKAMVSEEQFQSAIKAAIKNKDGEVFTLSMTMPQPSKHFDRLEFSWASFYHSGYVHTHDRRGIGGQNWNSNKYPEEDKYNAALGRTPYTNPHPFGKIGGLLRLISEKDPAQQIRTRVVAIGVSKDPDSSWRWKLVLKPEALITEREREEWRAILTKEKKSKEKSSLK